MLASLAYSGAMTFRDVRYPIAQGADDSGYYLTIAEHAARGLGFTFDGLAPTNGFHPLWEWLLVALHLVAPLPPEGMVRLVWLLQSVLMTVSAWLLWRLLRRHVGSWPALMGAAVYVGRLYYTGRDGMESSLLLVLVLLFLDRADAWGPPPSIRVALVMGVLAGAIMLARLDSFFAVSALALAWSLAGPPRRPMAAIACLAGASLVVSPYLASNLSHFGHLVPISGMLKSSFPHAGWRVATWNLEGQDRLVLQAATGAALVCLLWPRAREGSRFLRTLLPALAIGVLAHELYSALFMKWGVFSWHFVLQRLVLALALPVIGARLLPPRARAGAALWATGTLVVLAAGAWPLVQRDWRTDYSQAWTTQSYEAARWARRATPPDAIFAMQDAGTFGSFSDRRVVNLDGLVNTFAYQDSLAAGRLEGFLRSRRVGWFVEHAILDRPDVTDASYATWRFDAWSHLVERPGGSLTLRRRDEVYRSAPYAIAGRRCVFLIWRLPPP